MMVTVALKMFWDIQFVQEIHSVAMGLNKQIKNVTMGKWKAVKIAKLLQCINAIEP